MALSQTGITMSAVHCALGVITPLSSCTLSDLVKVGSINKWSKTKPIRHTGASLADTYSGLTGVMATTKYGFELASADTENGCLSLAASQADLWAYQKWTPSSTYPARLGDFRGYNHAAVSPFQIIDIDYNEPGVENTTHLPQYQMVAKVLSNTGSGNNYNANAEINPKDMFNGTSHKYVLLYRKQGTSSTSASSEVNMTNLTIDTGRITGTTSNTGTFECCLAIHKSQDTIWYPCPGTYRTFNVRNMTKEEYMGVYISNLCYLNATSTSSKMHYRVKMQIFNMKSTAVEVYAGAVIKGSNTSRDSIWSCTIPSPTTSSTPKWTIPANSSITLYGAGDDDDNMTLTTTDPGELVHEESASYYGLPIESTCYVRNVLLGDVTGDAYKVLYNPS